MNNLAELWQNWPLFGPWQFHPLEGGANNRVQLVDTPSSGSYFLKIFQPHRALGQINYELALLAALQQADLPFAVPVPVPTITGKKLVRLNDGDKAVVVSLLPLIEGTHPPPDSLEQAYAAGETLAQLDQALAEIKLETSAEIEPFPTYAEMCQGDPYVTDPVAALEQLALDRPSRARIIELWRQVMEAIPQLYRELPVQIIHADYDRSNVLMKGKRVTGVLDFEFSRPDLRALELAVALSWWPDGILGSGKEWAVIRALGQGYTSGQPLLPAEIEALPLLLQLRSIASLIHRIGRYNQGLDPEQAVLNRAKDVLGREDWLERNRANFSKLGRL